MKLDRGISVLSVAAALAAWARPAPEISGDIREALSMMSMVDLPVDDSGNTVHALRITGNVQIVNGSGATYGTWNGLGNLVIGYNERDPGFGPYTDRHGSHNLVLGYGNSYATGSGIIAGIDNYSRWAGASILSGARNEAWSGIIVGGEQNRVEQAGVFAVVGGGKLRSALGQDDFVAGSITEDN